MLPENVKTSDTPEDLYYHIDCTGIKFIKIHLGHWSHAIQCVTTVNLYLKAAISTQQHKLRWQ